MADFHQASSGHGAKTVQVRSEKLPYHICSTCVKLNLNMRLRNETTQQFIGDLSEYNDPDCPFCRLICKVIGRAWGVTYNSAKFNLSNEISCQLFIQSRSPLSVQEAHCIRHPQPRLLLATNKKPPNFYQNRDPQRKIDRTSQSYIVAEIESIPSQAELNYLPRLEVGSRINYSLLKSWLDECQKHDHSRMAMKQKKYAPFQAQNSFRLIDVEEECLVQKDGTCSYMALSYVWGSLPTLQFPGDNEREIPVLLTLQRNVKDLSVARSLSKLRTTSRATGRIPLTVRDAMEFTRQMGIRYLWVDTLCIIQDDPKDKPYLIGHMDDIYNHATATIVAAVGNNADAGLRGVSPRRGRPIEVTKIVNASNGTTLHLSPCLLSLTEETRDETWSGRGWVFQEQSLSQRCLYFTAEEIFFNCSDGQRREGYDYAHAIKTFETANVLVRTGPPWWTRNLRKDLDPTPYHYLGDVSGKLDVQAYQVAIQDYSRRNLTLPQDILNAFEGIFNRFARSSNEPQLSIFQVQGIHPHLLFQAILWFPIAESKKRVCKAGLRFSTWSWYVIFVQRPNQPDWQWTQIIIQR